MFLGIDCGTQGTKALLLDASSGRVLGQGSAGHDLISGPNGRREQDTGQWTAAFASATAAALAEAGVRHGVGCGESAPARLAGR